MQLPEHVILTVYYKGCSSLSSLHGRLYDARKVYFQTNHKVKERASVQEDGMEVRFRYVIRKRAFVWEKKWERNLLERAYKIPDGYCLDVFDPNGTLKIRTEYDKLHQFRKASYYGPDGRVQAELSCVPGKEELTLRQPGNGESAQTVLYPCPVRMGTAEQSMIDSSLGDPKIIAACLEGDYCYCDEQEYQQRRSLWQKIQEGGMSSEPVFLPQREESDPLDPECLPEQESSLPGSSAELSLAQERLCRLEDPGAHEDSWKEPDEVPISYLKDRLRQLEEQLMKNTALEQEDSLSIKETEETDLLNAERMEKDPTQPDVPSKEESSPSYRVDRELFRQDVPEHKAVEPPAAPTRYAVAKRSADGTVCAPGLKGEPKKVPKQETKADNAAPAKEPEAAEDRIVPVKSIVISQQESYRYFGQMLEEMRHGRGRTEMPDGKTAYEGGYWRDQRDGFGAYYYKTGRMCYVGDWQQNKRNGVGVGFRPGGGGLYAGGWKQDKPHGAGAVVDTNGSISYAGALVEGKRHGVGASYRAQDGTLLVARWDGDRFSGKVTLFDPQGRLCYSGEWKNGKRHGMGTQYLPDGQVGFAGRWEKDRPLAGVLYQDGIAQDTLTP
ncbi:membrane-binding protein [Clostridium minihomine]|uniref:membrane-binding protein n=1 Tax=Clostridium minihomine TaxID=2045012 RepID=UPI000C777BC6|nr:membrane-binding protein [Clostridium minihomine]